MTTKLLWQWRAWTGPHSRLKGKPMIADCGIVWAETLDVASATATKVVGGPFYNDVRKISVEPIYYGGADRKQIACEMDDATDGTETLAQMDTLARNASKTGVS